MPKFYIQCGPVRMVKTADSIDTAALAAIDRSLHCHLWIYDDLNLDPTDRRRHLMLEALLHLDPVIRISQRGFDRDDAVEVGTPETVQRWDEFMVGMSRLFAAAGLADRTVAQLAGAKLPFHSTPKRPR